MDPTSDVSFCRRLSLNHGEPIVASAASDTWVWLTLQYDGPWAAKAYAQADLPEPARATIDRWLAEIPGTRMQLIRRSGVARDAGLHFFVGWSRPPHAAVRRFRLERYEDLVTLDVPAIVAAMERGEDPGLGEVPELPLLLVCTNAKRDQCCAKWGAPVYRALFAREDVEVWQTTHLGGHRFAATLVTLPDGLCYGRLAAEETDALVEATRQRRIHRLDRFRGRTCFSSAGQAAEHFFRESHGRMDIDAVQALDVDLAGPRARVRLRDDTGAEHRLELIEEMLDQSAPPSCGKPPEPIRQWRPISIASA